MSFTELITLLGLGLGLAMDAFAVSVVSGSVYKQMHLGHGLRMASFFGGFQAIMPLTGWFLGREFGCYIEPVDHWIAFGMLSFIGGKMIYEAFEIKHADDRSKNPCRCSILLTLSIATSIDALAVGFTLSLVTLYIATAIVIIGVITCIISYLGWEIGRRIGHFFEIKIEALGGVVLILIGLKILIQHLFFMN